MEKIIYKFRGKMDNTILKNIISQMEEVLAEFGEKMPRRKKINSILIECCQNLIHHSDKSEEMENNPPVLSVSKTKKGYAINSGNLIPSEKVDKLKTYLDRINKMDKPELREYYNNVLNNGKISVKGGGGLGMLDIAKKSSDHKINYYFVPVNDKLQFFNMFFTV